MVLFSTIGELGASFLLQAPRSTSLPSWLFIVTLLGKKVLAPVFRRLVPLPPPPPGPGGAVVVDGVGGGEETLFGFGCE